MCGLCDWERVFHRADQMDPPLRLMQAEHAENEKQSNAKRLLIGSAPRRGQPVRVALQFRSTN